MSKEWVASFLNHPLAMRQAFAEIVELREATRFPSAVKAAEASVRAQLPMKQISFHVESGHPLVRGKYHNCETNRLSAALKKLKVATGQPDDQSLMFRRGNNLNLPYRAAQRAGVKIRLRKVRGQGYRIWRVA
jgi:hypothetical protein